MSPLTRMLPRLRSRWRVAGIVIATLSVAAALLSAATIGAGSAAAASCGTTNLALHQPTTASSIQGPSWPASNATDGNLSTRWSSAFSDPQWLEVDLGSTQSICQVAIHWETAYAKAFQIQASNDNSTWTTIYSTTAGTGGTQTLNVSGSGRYIRMYGTVRATQYGYSIYEFQVYAATSTGNTVTVTNPGAQTSTVGTAASLQVQASDSASGQTLTYSATGLPAGLSVNSSTGLISGTPTTAGTSTVTVTAKDATGASGSASLSWTVKPAGGNTVTVTNPGSQTSTVGTAVSLQMQASDSASGQTLTYTASGLPAGLSIGPSGLITGTPTTASTSTATVTATDSTGATGSAAFSWTVNTAGTGEPPASFWGNTSAIPAATHVLEVSIVNQTNGQYPDSEVYWSFNGQTESIAQQPYIDMPANSAGRMYFYLGSPNSQYYDFIEFTVGASSINVDTTRVDRFGLKLALLLHGHDGSNQEVGENYATFQESRSATFARFQNFVPTQFKELATDQAPYGIPSPGNDPAFQTGGAYASYYTSYAASVGDTADSTAQIFGCGGTLAANPTLCAGLNRHVAQLPAAEQTNPANFYLAAPANYYAEFWHQNAINGKQYGFPYDDDNGQSSDISVTNPQYMVVAVGW
jgi:F5/8 type C domain/Beta-1,3-glucanase/Putative Ig domain